MSEDANPPLILLHGGPSIPSNYLLPVINGVIDRSVILYDQYGCGKSARPKSGDVFSVAQHVTHLDHLLKQEWKLHKFHLLGHSWGGILAYEYLKHNSRGCRSLTLSSTPTCTKLVLQESRRLFHELGVEPALENNTHIPMAYRHFTCPEFQKSHECRLDRMPLALMDALQQAGPLPWRGLPAIEGWSVAESNRDSPMNVPTLLLRGQHDFCTDRCMEDWHRHLAMTQTTVLNNCSHYAMLEDEQQYGHAIMTFLQQVDRADAMQC
jgi:proline-specific peptidase